MGFLKPRQQSSRSLRVPLSLWDSITVPPAQLRTVGEKEGAHVARLRPVNPFPCQGPSTEAGNPGVSGQGREALCVSMVRRRPPCLAGARSKNTEASASHTAWPGRPRGPRCDWKQQQGPVLGACRVAKSCRDEPRVGRRENLLGQQLAANPWKDPNTK